LGTVGGFLLDARARRKLKRAWLRENRDELESLAVWLSQPEKFVFQGRVFRDRHGDVLELQPESREAFGEGSRTHKEWISWLKTRGILVEAYLRT